MNDSDSEPIINAIRELRPGDWDATIPELVDGILILRDAQRQTECCRQPLTLVIHTGSANFHWSLLRCDRCEAHFVFGPKLPPTWVGALARRCILSYQGFRGEVSRKYRASV